MAAVTMDANLYAIADSLSMEAVPVKLRCATCNKLVVGAFRTPCCEQTICEKCQPTFPEACPICLHEPVKAEDCRPNKALRTTVKAFLKKILTQQEQAQKKQATNQKAAAPAAVSTTTTTDIATPSRTSNRPTGSQADGAMKASSETPTVPVSTDQSQPSVDGEDLPTEAQKDVPQPSIEATEDRVREESFQEQDRGDAAALAQAGQTENGLQQPQVTQTQAATNPSGMGQGLNGAAFGMGEMTNGFPNMAFANPADFNSMMQFMPNSAMGGFPNMMGMPGMPGMGMGMDPMQAMSQGMLGGFGGAGMGMNGMNAGMGFPAGQMWNGGFNEQPGSWMSGQDKFNQNGFGGHANGMGGDFGANNAGYSGYNMPSHQGNYNQMNHQQFPNHDFKSGYHGQGFHNRGRGRGRYHSYAARGRGGYNQVMNGSHTNHEQYHNESPQYPRQDNSYSQNPQQSEGAEKQEVDEFGRDISGLTKPKEVTDEEIARAMAPGDADENEDQEGPATTGTQEAPATTDENKEPPIPSTDDLTPHEDPNKSNADNQTSAEKPQEREKPAAIQTFTPGTGKQAELTSPTSAVTANTMLPPPTPVVPQAPRSSSFSEENPYEYNARARTSSRDYSRGSSDFRGFGRGRGTIQPHHETTNHMRPGSQPAPPPAAAPIEPKGVGVVGAPKGPKAMREGISSTGIRGGRGFSIVGRAASAAHGRSNGHARSRSTSPAHPRSPSRDHSRRHRSHRHRSASRSKETTDDERERRRERHDRHKRRSRKHDDSEEEKDGHTSPSHRSSHRSRRDRGDDDREEDHESRHRSHRSRRHNRDRRDRDRDKDKETRRSSRKRSRTPTSPAEEIHIKIEPSSSTSSSRKRREREHYKDEEEADGYEHQRHDRKRSRRDDHAEEPSPPPPATNGTVDHQKSSRSDPHSRNDAKPSIPTGPKSHRQPSSRTIDPSSTAAPPPPPQLKPPATTTDPHELERQARNRERMQKELQRREAMEGKGHKGHKGAGGAGGGGGGSLGRRVSYKYEDELEGQGGHDRVEREREAGRWG